MCADGRMEAWRDLTKLTGSFFDNVKASKMAVLMAVDFLQIFKHFPYTMWTVFYICCRIKLYTLMHRFVFGTVQSAKAN